MAQVTKRTLPLKVERQDSVRAWLKNNRLPDELLWDGQPHVACKCVPAGHWQFLSMGDYQGADWQHRLYISHRCSKCGMMVQHNQTLPESGEERQPLQRLVVIP